MNWHAVKSKGDGVWAERRRGISSMIECTMYRRNFKTRYDCDSVLTEQYT